MGLYGSLETMPLSDLYRWIGETRKSGLLQVTHDHTGTRLRWEQGRIKSCSSDDPPKLLGQFLLFRGVIIEDELRQAMARQATTGESLPDILVDLGTVGRDELELEVAAKAEETILGLFDLPSGSFEFLEGEHSDANGIAIDVDVEDLILQGDSRRRHLRRAREIFGHPGIVPVRTSKERVPDSMQHDIPCRRVYRAVDGTRTVEEIVLRAHGTEYRVTACLLKLHREGLIDAAPAAGAGPGSDRGGDSTAPAPGPVDVDEARRAIVSGRPDRALESLRRARQADPTDSAVRRLIDEAEKAMLTVLEAEGFSSDKVPVPLRSRDELAGEQISPEQDFLLALSDGTWDVRSLTWVAPMRSIEVLLALRDLHGRGLIELRESA